MLRCRRRENPARQTTLSFEIKYLKQLKARWEPLAPDVQNTQSSHGPTKLRVGINAGYFEVWVGQPTTVDVYAIAGEGEGNVS